MLGIGKYDQEKALIGMNRDYYNMKYAFNFYFGYPMVYQKSESSQLNFCMKKCEKEANCEDAFKTRWNYDEIDAFTHKIQKYFENNVHNHDGLIFIISSHGNENNEILASDSEPYLLQAIFRKFDATNCKSLKDKPKLFFIDACRGRKGISNNPNVPTRHGSGKNKRGYQNNYNDSNNNRSNSNSSNSNHNKTSTNRGRSRNRNNNNTTNNRNNNNYNNYNSNHKNNNSNNSKVSKKNSNGNKNKNKSKKNDESGKRKARKSKKGGIANKPLPLPHHKEGSFRFIYANAHGFAALDNKEKGGFLIESIREVFCQTKSSHSNLDEIISEIRQRVKEKTKHIAVQNIQDVVNSSMKITFVKSELTK